MSRSHQSFKTMHHATSSFFLLSCCLTFPILVLGQWEPWIPAPQQQQDWMPWVWMDRFNANVNRSNSDAGSIQIIFNGDSITEGWDYMNRPLWDAAYGSLGAVNYAISGDASQHVLWRNVNGELDNINLRPRMFVLKVGTNNVNINFPELVDQIFMGVEANVAAIRQRVPSAKILVLAILPRISASETEFVERINANTARLDDGNMVRFLNMRDTFYRGNGQFNTELYDQDLLHLSSAGYTAWHGAMDPLFQQMWNS